MVLPVTRSSVKKPRIQLRQSGVEYFQTALPASAAIVIAGSAFGEVASPTKITLPIPRARAHAGVILVVVFAALAVIAYLVLSRAYVAECRHSPAVGPVLICLLALVPIAAVGEAAVSAAG